MNSMSRNSAWLALVAIGAVGLLPACGPGETGTGGSGGSTTTTSSSGGTGGTGGETGGTTTTTEGAKDGEPCMANEDCAGGFCLTQAEFGWPYGYCTGPCNSFITCDEGSLCLFLGNDPFCIKECQVAADCGPGQECFDLQDGTFACAPFCTKDEECAGFGVCDEDSGACFVPEDCAADGDEDGDGLSNCEDSDCAATCQAQIEAACGAATTFDVGLGAPVVKNGDNSNGTDLFAGICSGGANKENIFKVTNTSNVDGIIELALVSADDLAVYARTDCASGELACADALAGGADPELIDVPAAKSTSFFAYVDGSSFDGMPHAAAYTLTATLIPVQAEVEPNNDGPMPGPSTANTVTIASLPALPVGSIDQVNDDDDWFVIDTTAVGVKTITAETIGYGGDVCAPSGEVDTTLEIVDDTGTSLDSNDDAGFTNWCSFVTVENAAAGKYYLHVKTSSFCTPDPMGSDCAFKYGIKINLQ